MPITLNIGQWMKLREKLTEDYGRGIMLIRSRMRDKLGFTDREHRWWEEGKGYQTHICLDFYNEPKRTMFMLKYSEFLDKSGKIDLRDS